jgi:hypothetical protein
VTGGSARTVVVVLVAAILAAGAFYFWRSFQRPDSGKAPNVADAPAGGRTQAQPTSDSTGAIAVTPPGDPLLPGIPERPDVPADAPHSGIKKAGERIREAVLADGTVGDHETPGIDMTSLTQTQRKWFLAQATKIACSCGCRQDLLECRRDDATCPISPGLSDSLLAVAGKR